MASENQTKAGAVYHTMWKTIIRLFEGQPIPPMQQMKLEVGRDIALAANSFVRQCNALVSDLTRASEAVAECGDLHKVGGHAAWVRSTSLYGDVQRGAETLGRLSQLFTRVVVIDEHAKKRESK